MASNKPRQRKLPVQQLLLQNSRLSAERLHLKGGMQSLLPTCRLAESLSSTSIYAYLPEMIESLQVPQSEVGKWVGICAGAFSLTEAIMGIPWGRFSDQYGRKPAILLGLCGTMSTDLLWGFSKNLPMAIVARALAGAGNGNLGIARTTVAEMVPFKELQPRAFSILPLVWNIGSIFGPTIGGALANPRHVEPGEIRHHPDFFEVYPYALPNIVCACVFFISIIIGVLFLDETLENCQGRRDRGRILGQKITNAIRARLVNIRRTLQTQARSGQDPSLGESDPLLEHQPVDTHEENGLTYEIETKERPTWQEVVTQQAFTNLVVYMLLAMHSMAFDQIVVVYMRYQPIGHLDSTPYEAPLRFAGGLGLDHLSIGLIRTGYGVAGMALQFLVFPPFARRYGVLRLLKIVVCTFPLVYLVTPFTALLPTTNSQVSCMLVVMVLKCLCGVFAFPCTTILITNSASSLRTLGTLNGIAISVSAIGRATGPAMLGMMMTVGVRKGYIIAPWWFLSAISIIAAIPVFWLVEGEKAGVSSRVIITPEDEEDDEVFETVSVAADAGHAELVYTKSGNILELERDDEEHM